MREALHRANHAGASSRAQGIAGHRANRCPKYPQGPRPFQKRFGYNRFAWRAAGVDGDATAGASAQAGLRSRAPAPSVGPDVSSLAGALGGSKPPLAAHRNAFATADRREQKNPCGLSNSALAILRHGDDSSRNPRRPVRGSVLLCFGRFFDRRVVIPPSGAGCARRSAAGRGPRAGRPAAAPLRRPRPARAGCAPAGRCRRTPAARP